MRQRDGKLNNIFGGLNPEISTRKRTGGLLEGHNIEPLKDDYAVHEALIDMNATGQDWNTPAIDRVDYWSDNDNDTFNTDDTDEFTDI